MKKVKLILTTLLLAASGLSAANIPIVNSDFETQILADGSWQNGVSGWNAGSNQVGLFNPDSGNFTDEALYGNTAFCNAGVLSQVLSTNLLADTTYTLSVDVGNRLDSAFPGYSLELVANGQVLIALAGLSNSIASDSFDNIELVYVSSSSDPVGFPIEIRLSSVGTQTNFDNVTLTTSDNPCGELVGDFITEDVTLDVSNSAGDFATINEALDCLAGKTIFQSAVVTIQVADGTYTNYDSVIVNHPQGGQIQILGNTSDATAVKLVFNPTINGVHVLNGARLKLFNGFTIDGGDGLGFGVRASANGTLILGSEMIVENWRTGVSADNGAYIFADGVLSRNNTNIGFVCNHSSMMFARNSTSDNNLSQGYSISKGASARLNNATSQNNGAQGVQSIYNAMADIRGMVFINNAAGTAITNNGGVFEQ